MEINHTTGIAYNPQGQALVEHANCTFKKQTKKKTQKWGDNKDPPQVQLPKALFILNFLNSFGSNTEPHLGRTDAERHFNNLHSPKALEKVPFGGKIFKLINGS